MPSSEVRRHGAVDPTPICGAVHPSDPAGRRCGRYATDLAHHDGHHEHIGKGTRLRWPVAAAAYQESLW